MQDEDTTQVHRDDATMIVSAAKMQKTPAPRQASLIVLAGW